MSVGKSFVLDLTWPDKWEVSSSRWVWESTYPDPRYVPIGVHYPSRMLNHHLPYSQPPQGVLQARVTWLKPVNVRNWNVLNLWCPSSPLNDSKWQKHGSDKFTLGFGLFNDVIIEGKSFNSGQFSFIREQYWYTSVKKLTACEYRVNNESSPLFSQSNMLMMFRWWIRLTGLAFELVWEVSGTASFNFKSKRALFLFHYPVRLTAFFNKYQIRHFKHKTQHFTWTPFLLPPPPSPSPKRTNVRTSGFNFKTTVYTKDHLKPKLVRVCETPPPPPSPPPPPIQANLVHLTELLLTTGDRPFFTREQD